MLQFEAAEVDADLQDRHCKFADGTGKVNHYANMTGCKSTALTLAGTQTYGWFQPHESFMLGPSPGRELCMETSPDAYRQEEFLNDLRSDCLQSPDAHRDVNAREMCCQDQPVVYQHFNFCICAIHG